MAYFSAMQANVSNYKSKWGGQQQLRTIRVTLIVVLKLFDTEKMNEKSAKVVLFLYKTLLALWLPILITTVVANLLCKIYTKLSQKNCLLSSPSLAQQQWTGIKGLLWYQIIMDGLE